MLRVKAGGGVAAEGRRGEILAVIVVEPTEEVAFCIVVRGVRVGALTVDHGAFQLMIIPVGEHVLLRGRELHIVVLVILMPQECGEVVAVAEGMVVVQQLLEVERGGAIVIDRNASLLFDTPAVEGVSGAEVALSKYGCGGVEGELQLVGKEDVCKGIAVQRVRLGLLLIDHHRLDREVGVGRAHQLGASRSHTIVVHLTVLVGADVAVGVAQVDGVNRRNALREGGRVGRF